MSEANILTWSLQIGVLVTACAAAGALLRLRIPGARLFYWQMVLLACLALPLVRPWKHEAIADTVTVTTMAVVRPANAPAGIHIPLDKAVLWLLAAGILGRAVWLAAGFWRLRLYRRRSRLLDTREGAALLLSEDIASPVTFGALRPVVLLPAQFPELDFRVREAILCHELLHVRRRDWVFTVMEEIVRAVWWFHPAVWWLLGQIQLAREQAVDREVIETTHSREEYVDALLSIAGVRPQLDLAPAPLFLRQRHLKQRVVSILKEVRMSKTRLVSSLAAALGILVTAGWLVTAVFPLAAAPQAVADAEGVTVDLGGATLLHRAPVTYPEPARQRGIQGTIQVQMKLDGSGNVADAQVLSGPDELRKAALQSVLNWHFTSDLAGSTRQAAIAFQLPAGTARAAEAPAASAPVLTLSPLLATARVGDRTIKSLNIVGLPGQARADLLSRLPAHEGSTLTQESMRQLVQVIRNFDEHLVVSASPANGEAALVITLPPSTPLPAAAGVSTGSGPSRVRVGGNLQATKLVFKSTPAYPPLAKQARIQGTVSLQALIGEDGGIQNLTVISGHPLLVPSALEAVRKWVYEPTLLNGAPTEVETQIDVNYTLAE